MVCFINGKAHWSLWLAHSVSMRQRGEKRKEKKADICQKATFAKWEIKTCLEKVSGETTGWLVPFFYCQGSSLSGKTLFNDHFHILEGQVKENTNPFRKVAAVLFSYYCFVGI